MKISKSKQELALIISENGGWFDGAEWACQDKIGVEAVADEIAFYEEKPSYQSGYDMWNAKQPSCTVMHSFPSGGLLKNWHQTILSREEYFHLYPAPDDKPSIEKLAADYRNSKDYAELKQREADAAKDDADAKLKVLELACESIGLFAQPITEKKEPELVITDWRDLRAGDVVEAVVPNGGIVKAGELGVIILTSEDKMFADFQSQKGYVCYKCQFERGDVKLIRRT